MIAIIVMIMLFLGFFVVVAFNMMSINHNLSVSSQMETIDNELEMIKTRLIQSAKPISGSDEYSLPYGEDFSSINEHRLPSNMGLSLKNIKGQYYHYCPYGIDDSTNKTSIVTQNDGSSYNVNNKTIDGIVYTTHSDSPVSFSGAPEIQGFIISKYDNAIIDCSDVLYDSNSAVFYLTNAKVEYITKQEILDYYSLQDLSGVIEKIDLKEADADDLFNVIENDTSNKSYEILLSEDITLSNDYSFERRKNKESNISFNLNGHSLFGSNKINFKNVNVEFYNSGLPNVSDKLIDLEFVDSNVVLENALVGGLSLNHSDLIVDGSKIQSDFNYGVNLRNSNVVIRGNSFIEGTLSQVENALLYLEDTKMFIEEGAELNLYNHGGQKPNNLISLYNSDLSIYGELSEHSSSNTVTNYPFYIDFSSKLYLNGGSINVLGYLRNYHASLPVFMLKGNITSEGNKSVINATKSGNMYHFINIEGGSMDLTNIEFAENNILTTATSGYTINSVNAKHISGNSSVIVNGAGGRCWKGSIFKNNDGSNAGSTSGTDKENNISSYRCE